MRWVGQVAHMEEMNAYRILVKKHEKRPLGNRCESLGVNKLRPSGNLSDFPRIPAHFVRAIYCLWCKLQGNFHAILNFWTWTYKLLLGNF